MLIIFNIIILINVVNLYIIITFFQNISQHLFLSYFFLTSELLSRGKVLLWSVLRYLRMSIS
jgi:hypothetical protein